MSEKEERQIPCPNPECRNMLRITFSEIDHGRNVDVICPTCDKKCRITIVSQQKVEGIRKNIQSVIESEFSKNEKISEAIREAIKDGFVLHLQVNGQLVYIGQESQDPVQPKVVDGKIVDGTFISEDDKWAKALKIKL